MTHDFILEKSGLIHRNLEDISFFLRFIYPPKPLHNRFLIYFFYPCCLISVPHHPAPSASDCHLVLRCEGISGCSASSRSGLTVWLKIFPAGGEVFSVKTLLLPWPFRPGTETKRPMRPEDV